MQILCSPLAGSVSDRVEPRIVASLGMGMTMISLIMLTFLDAASSIAFVAACLAILGVGLALFASPNINATMGSVDKKSFGVASAMIATMRLVGQAFSMGMTLILFALYIGRIQITPDSYPLFLKSMTTAFAIAAGLCCAGIFISVARGRMHR
jgi:MFS family permease